MKKRQAPSKPLVVAVETIRELATRRELVQVAGGQPPNSRPQWTC